MSGRICEVVLPKESLMKTLIIFSHTYYVQSKVNRRLLEIANLIPDVTIRNLDGLYGTDFTKIDVPEEQRLLTENNRIVFQFPVFWFSTPPMLKAYMDQVFTHGWAYGSEGHALAGKQFMVAASTGSSLEKYRKGGFTMEELLRPLMTSAAFVGMVVDKPMITYGCLDITEEGIKAACQEYRKLLTTC